MSGETSFSIVVPCYNYAHYLKACVDSILTQGVKVQVIVIDEVIGFMIANYLAPARLAPLVSLFCFFVASISRNFSPLRVWKSYPVAWE